MSGRTWGGQVKINITDFKMLIFKDELYTLYKSAVEIKYKIFMDWIER